MAAEDRGFRAHDDASSIALLRSIRSGVADFSFVHRADVCSAAPADLVANLEPVPGTDLDQGGYNSIWYFYSPKRFKNARGSHSGHRHRAIAGGDTCWHSESSPKPVKGLDGATVCNLSYGRKEEGSSRSFNRLGWCMLEYDDKHVGGDDHVLCKIYRSSSSLARGKSKPTTTQRLSGCKRKAAGDHAESLPTKMSHAQACSSVDREFLDHQVQQPLLTDNNQVAMLDSLFSSEDEPFQHSIQSLLWAEVEHFEHNTQSLLPAEEQQFQDNTQSLMPADEQQFQLQDNTQFLLPADEQQFQFQHSTQSLLWAEEEQFEHNTQSLSPADEQQFQLQDNTQFLLPADEQQFQFQHSTQSLLWAEEEQFEFQHNIQSLLPGEEQQFQDNTQSLLPADEQQFQLEDNTQSFLLADEQQFQLQDNSQFLLPADEQQFQFEDNAQSLLPADEQQFQFEVEDNTQFTIGELLGYPENADEFMINRCGGTPTTMAPPDASFFDGLAF